MARYPSSSREISVTYSTDGGHSVSHEKVVGDRFRLDVWTHDLGVLSKVPSERFTLPASFGFHHVEWDAP